MRTPKKLVTAIEPRCAPMFFRSFSAVNASKTRRRGVGITFACSERSSEVGLSSRQIGTGRRTIVKRQRRFGTEVEAASIEATQIMTLIDSLSRCVQLLGCDIETEEERTKCCDLRDPAYSVLARSLTTRRDNLAATIAALQERLSRTEVLTAPNIGSATDLLLPAYSYRY
jgi:hypothetical protein